MPWSVDARVEFGPLAATLAVALLVATVTVVPWSTRRRLERLRGAGEHDPGAFVRFYRDSIAVGLLLLAADLAVLATAVSLPAAAVGLGLPDLGATAANVRTLSALSADLPEPFTWAGAALALFVAVWLLLVVALLVGNTVWLAVRQRRERTPYYLLAPEGRIPPATVELLRLLTPATATQRRWLLCGEGIEAVETSLRYFGVLTALLVGVFEVPVLAVWCVLAALLWVNSYLASGGGKEAANAAVMGLMAGALSLFFLPGSLLAPLALLALNSLLPATAPLDRDRRERPVRAVEVLPETEPPG